MRLPVPILAAVAAAVVVAGCGGDDGASKEDFAKDANAICKDIEQRFRSLRRDQPRTPAEANQRISQVEDGLKEAVSRLGDVERPGGSDGDTAKEFVDTLDKQVNDDIVPGLQDLREAIRDRNAAAVRRANARLQRAQGSQEGRDVNRLARELGANECAG